MIIRSIVPHLVFQVECESKDVKEATDLANELAAKLVSMGSKGINQRFPNLEAMRSYLAVL